MHVEMNFKRVIPFSSYKYIHIYVSPTFVHELFISNAPVVLGNFYSLMEYN